MKVKIILENKVSGEVLTLYNEVFNTNNGIAFFEIDKNQWKLLDFKPLVFTKNEVDYYEGDKVLVKGTKKVGEYATEIIKDLQGWTLKYNRTYFNNDKCFTAIKSKL